MADSLTFKGQPDGVHFVARKRIARWLSLQPVATRPDFVEAIYAVARHRRTWQPAPDLVDQENL